jgi:hypothetical protein
VIIEACDHGESVRGWLILGAAGRCCRDEPARSRGRAGPRRRSLRRPRRRLGRLRRRHPYGWRYVESSVCLPVSGCLVWWFRGFFPVAVLVIPSVSHYHACLKLCVFFFVLKWGHSPGICINRCTQPHLLPSFRDPNLTSQTLYARLRSLLVRQNFGGLELCQNPEPWRLFPTALFFLP